MKILFVIDNLGSGGAQNQLSLIASALHSKGINTSVFTYYPQNFFEERLLSVGVDLVHKSKKGKLGWNVISALTKIIKQKKPDVIVSFLDTPNFYSGIAKFLSRQKAITVISYRSKSDFGKMTFWSRKIKEWLNSYADLIICNSIHEAKRWSQNYPNLSSKIHTLYNIVDLEKFKPVNLSRPSNHILCIGSPSVHKNGLCVIEALRILTEKKIDVYIKWVGQKVHTIPSRKKYILKMEKKLSEYNLEGSWEWTQPTTHVDKLYKEHRALVLASKTEGLPNVICESLSSGLPVIASNVLDHPILLNNKKNGFLFDPDSPQELSEKIEKMISLSQKEYQTLCLNARDYASKTFEKEQLLSSFVKLISN